MDDEKHAVQKLSVPLAIVAITVLGFLMRLQTLHLGLWRDEIYTQQFARVNGFAQLVEAMRFTDYNPPAYYLLMQPYSAIFGTSETAMVWPSIVLGTVAIPAAAWLAGCFRSRTAIILAPFLLAITPEAIYYSNQARNQILLALLLCVDLTIFFRALQADLDGRARQRNLWLVAFAVLVALTIYTSFSGVLAMVALAGGFFAVWVYERRSRLIPYALALLVPALSYLFWMPIMLAQQKVGVPWWDKNTSLSQMPLMFLSNIACLFPLPFPVSFFVSTGLLLVVLLLCVWKARSLWDLEPEPLKRLQLWLSTNHSWRFCLMLTVFLLVPISLFGNITGFQTGYFRYMAPFCPAGSVAMALVFECLYRLIDGGGNVRRLVANVVAGIALVALLAADVMYCVSAATLPKSGFRAMARDAQQGKYDQSVVVVATDACGLTYQYYLDEYKVDPQQYALIGFALEKPVPVPCNIYAQAWQDENAVARTLALIDQTLRQKHWTRVVLAMDVFQPDLKTFPAKKRMQELYEALKSTYDVKGETVYGGELEQPTVTVFEVKKR